MKFLEKLALQLLPGLKDRLEACELNSSWAFQVATVALKRANECDECSACNEPVTKEGQGGYEN